MTRNEGSSLYCCGSSVSMSKVATRRTLLGSAAVALQHATSASSGSSRDKRRIAVMPIALPCVLRGFAGSAREHSTQAPARNLAQSVKLPRQKKPPRVSAAAGILLDQTSACRRHRRPVVGTRSVPRTRRHLVALGVHALHIRHVVTPLHAVVRVPVRVGARRAAQKQSGAGTDRGARPGPPRGGADDRSGRGTQSRTAYGVCSRCIRRRLLRARPQRILGVLPARNIVGAEFIEALRRSRKRHDRRTGRYGHAAHQKECAGQGCEVYARAHVISSAPCWSARPGRALRNDAQPPRGAGLNLGVVARRIGAIIRIFATLPAARRVVRRRVMLNVARLRVVIRIVVVIRVIAIIPIVGVIQGVIPWPPTPPRGAETDADEDARSMAAAVPVAAAPVTTLPASAA